jgi:RNA polymerase sigma factor (sigma-70 family)
MFYRHIVRGEQSGADDIVAEAFANVFACLIKGRGPTENFRSYLFTTIHNLTCNNWAREHRINRYAEIPDNTTMTTVADEVIHRLNSRLLVTAFHSLPDRWRFVLYHRVVLDTPTTEVGAMLGISSNGVAALASRARLALRIAYFQAHINVPAECAYLADYLASLVHGRLIRPLRKEIASHVDGCTQCAEAAAELADMMARSRYGVV